MQQQLFEQGIALWERSLCRARESPGLGGKIENKKKLSQREGHSLGKGLAPSRLRTLLTSGERYL